MVLYKFLREEILLTGTVVVQRLTGAIPNTRAAFSVVPVILIVKCPISRSSICMLNIFRIQGVARVVVDIIPIKPFRLPFFTPNSNLSVAKPILLFRPNRSKNKY